MKIIGVTGGIGSGKSTVAQILKEMGAKVIDADIISKEIIYKDKRVLPEIVEYFGKGVLTDTNELDRKKLGDIVFGNTKKLKDLELITHKYIISELIEQIDIEKQKDNTKIIVLEASIPVKHGFEDLVEEIWVVIAKPEDRIKRVMLRNAVSSEEVFKRINSQINENEYLKIADKVIENYGTKLDLKSKINCLIDL
jgi:dephospho-CoA kinase